MNEKEIALSNLFPTGDEGVLEQVIDCYGGRLLRYCSHVLFNYHDAQDVVQATFIKAYRYRHKFASGTNLGAWLFQIAYRYCMDHMKRDKLRNLLPLEQVTDTHDGGLGSDDGLSEPVLSALMALSPRERALIYGRVIEGRSYLELEEIMGVRQATLRKQYERSKKKLADELRTLYFKEGGTCHEAT